MELVSSHVIYCSILRVQFLHEPQAQVWYEA